jgi:type I restriction enzyme S subunit
MELLQEQKVDMPVGWKRIPLGAVIETKPGNNKLIKGKQFDEPGPGRYPGFSATGQDIYCAVAEYDRDGIVLSAVGARCGKCFMATGKWTAVANTHVLLPKLNEVDTKFIWYLLNDENFWVKSGTAQPFVAVKKSMEIEVALPPLPQQRRIVEAIELQLGRLDAAVARLQGAKARLKRYKQAVLKAAVDEADVENEETLGTLSELVTSGSRGWADYYADSGDIFIRAQNLKYDVLDLSDIAYVQLPAKVDGLRTQVMKHDILITITGANVTKTALVEHDLDGRAFVNQHVALVRLKDPTLAPFVYRWLISPAHGRGILEKLAYGAGKPGLNLSNIRDLSIPLPSVADQEAAVERLNEIDAVNNELETTLDAQLQQAVRLRQAVLKRAFEGRLM